MSYCPQCKELEGRLEAMAQAGDRHFAAIKELRAEQDRLLTALREATARAERAERAVEAVAGELATALAELREFRSLVDDLLTVWQGYAEHQFKSATGMQRGIVADRAQTFLDLKLALEHPKTIVWPDGHPRKALAKMSPTEPRREPQ